MTKQSKKFVEFFGGTKVVLLRRLIVYFSSFQKCSRREKFWNFGSHWFGDAPVVNSKKTGRFDPDGAGVLHFLQIGAGFDPVAVGTIQALPPRRLEARFHGLLPVTAI